MNINYILRVSFGEHMVVPCTFPNLCILISDKKNTISRRLPFFSLKYAQI